MLGKATSFPKMIFQKQQKNQKSQLGIVFPAVKFPYNFLQLCSNTPHILFHQDVGGVIERSVPTQSSERLSVQ